jgi:hypothetical protein
MRPYLVLCAVILIAGSALAQQPLPHPYGLCPYGCSPFVPLVSTPMISLQTVSPNPVGASNATTGLVAGATDSTLSEISGSTSSSYTVPVWYQGGAPLTTSDVNIWPETLGREKHWMGEERGPRERGHGEEGHRNWMYLTGSDESGSVVVAAGAAKGERKAGHVYTNEDVTRQNDNNGMVKYDGKTEKM